ncbi:MAG: PLP-dependent transferase [Alphaproteobacteria bacterium]|nr:MAG: PLP-dependent transferase [Alphaproteobacteria bacterium]
MAENRPDGAPAPLRPATVAAHGGHDPEAAGGDVVPPIRPATTFARDADYALLNPEGSYSRDANPTYRACESLLARLEGGAGAYLFSSGMAAAMAVVQALQPGDHIVAQSVMYWALRDWLREFCATWGLGFDLVDATDSESLAAAIVPGRTRLVWIETPSNPTWDVIDIAAAARAAHAAGARLVVDSTVATPVLTRPIELGADIVLHSATKYLNGHSDVVAGALIAAREDEFWHRVRANRAHGGAVLGPFEAWLMLRGMRTLYIRVARACANAMAIARHFDAHPKVAEVLYPGLETHPGHDLAARQMSGGFGGMLSLRVRGGAQAALAMAGRLRVFVRATSLGGVESLIEHRASIEGPGSPVPPDLLRLSVGIEDPADLIADLEQALADVPPGS